MIEYENEEEFDDIEIITGDEEYDNDDVEILTDDEEETAGGAVHEGLTRLKADIELVEDVGCTYCYGGTIKMKKRRIRMGSIIF